MCNEWNYKFSAGWIKTPYDGIAIAKQHIDFRTLLSYAERMHSIFLHQLYASTWCVYTCLDDCVCARYKYFGDMSMNATQRVWLAQLLRAVYCYCFTYEYESE